MKTESIKISSTGTGRDKALAITEKTGAFVGLDHNNSLRLRLLSEELIGLMNSFTDELLGDFWLEAKNENIEIHLKTEIPMDLKTRKELLSVSTSGKNSAAKSFMGKIREMIELATLPEDPEIKALTDQAMGLMNMGCQMGTHSSNYSWAMSTYVASIENESETKSEAKDALADLERSIVANLADDVTVHIVGSDVEITIYKTF
ncbi:MAG: hypothetical protein K5869_12230 [Saccharofermentans sp.]|nr:hypothetical protein [Saccharofermentans sp.]